MNRTISKTSINSFVGNVIPLWIKSEEDISKENFVWTSTSDCVQIRTFDDDTRYSFKHGVLLTLLKVGSATIIARCGNESFECDVNIREMKKATAEDVLNFYVADFHDHTSLDHNSETFPERVGEKPIDYLRQVEAEGKLDSCVVTDHADVLSHRDFFRGFTDAEEIAENAPVIFPGSESEVTIIENDRFGLPHKNSGEIVTVNAENYAGVKTWDEFYDAFKSSPFAVCVFAHPQIIGWDANGLWNFNLKKNATPELKRLVKAVEMGDGSDRSGNMVHESFYTVALDYGFRVSTTCGSDCHGPKWGYDVMPGKTIIMAPEKTKEAFLDALMNNRMYSCDSGNIKLSYSVNGHRAPCDLPDTDKYSFSVHIDQFKKDEESMPIICRVISDYGKVLKEIDCKGKSTLEFDVKSDSARYFYLRLTDSQGKKTRSVPVWTGREFDKPSLKELPVLDKSDFTAKDEISGNDASNVINNNPRDGWSASMPTASIVIDMKKDYEVCGIGHYPTRVVIDDIKDSGVEFCFTYAKFVSGYRVSVSQDGINYKQCADGFFRIYGAEEIVEIEPQRVRYIKFEALSSAGKNSEFKRHADAPVSIGELTVFGTE